MGADQAYQEGAQAAKNGRPLSDNPYPAGSEENLSWTDGWKSVNK